MYGQYSQQPFLPRQQMVPRTTNEIQKLRQIQLPISDSQPRMPSNNEMLLGTHRSGTLTMTRHHSENYSDRYTAQTKISEYFAEAKKVNNLADGYARPAKRTLKDLQRKYDNIYSQPINIPQKISAPVMDDRKNNQRVSYPRQIVNVLADGSRNRNQQSRNLVLTQKNKVTSPQQKPTNKRKMIHLIGFVENVLRWSDLLKNTGPYVVYNVLGIFINAMSGTHALEKIVFLRGNNGTILECSYFEVDRQFPKVVKGQFVECFGRVIGAQRFHCYSIDILDALESIDTQRALFLSQRTVYELIDT